MLFQSEGKDILVIGSSTTAGVGPSSLDKRWIALVEAARPQHNFYVATEGGSDVDDWPSDIGFGILPQNQDIIILQLGINLWLTGTANATFELNVAGLMGQIYTYHPAAVVFFLRAWMPRTSYDSQVIKWADYGYILSSFQEFKAYYNPFFFLDRYETNPEIYRHEEGIHYNDLGHELLAKTILDLI